ncbi:nitrate transporter 1.12 [Hibiscus trionum]|uniref:Nitrate transporter 1.12 n=1 Tax=Hibiscus trionum TaxID=183268 RepID=A0A9W7M744_HIBTR|nr:nitrate transporter 1.12 [Hibiscus trionum]
MGTPSDANKKMKEPLLVTAPTSKGGFKALPFIFASEVFQLVASVGLLPNMILYLKTQYGLENAKAANLIFIWSAANQFTPVVGAFLADSYVGRYLMIGFGSIFSFLGMVLLWSTAMFTQARPRCDKFSSTCESPTTPQLLLLYSSLALISIGGGGLKSSSLAFGADQLTNRNNAADSRTLESYFSWYYVFVQGSALIAFTCIVYVQDKLGWKMGFGVPAILMFISGLVFFLASPLYVKSKTGKSLLTGFARVLSASFRNRHIDLSSQAGNEVKFFRKGSVLHVPSEKLRFLNKACVINDTQQDLASDDNASNPWSLCTVDQVEDLKALIRVIPVWSTGIIVTVTYSLDSFVVLQAGTMDRHITPNFEIPAGSFGVFTAITLIIAVALYDRIALPLASKIKGKPVRLSLKQRMGIGLLWSCGAMVSVATVEHIRREIAIREGLSEKPQAMVHMSALWILLYCISIGLASAFCGIGQAEFFYTELPKTMSTVAANLQSLGASAGSVAAGFITSTVDGVTKTRGESWISSNINKGHYDYYYWLLTALSVLNFFYFLACSKAYGPCQGNEARTLVRAHAFEKEDHETIDDC